MTLVLTAHGRDTLWVLADRRLSYADGRPPIDDALKVMRLETDDGVGILAYAGLGSTSRGTEPSEWMSAVLRGRGGLKFEQALGILSEAARRELPRHLAQLPGGGYHVIVASAFIDGRGPHLFAIEGNVLDATVSEHEYRRIVPHQGPTVPLSMAGSGAHYLARRDPAWQRALHDLMKAHDAGRIDEFVMADHLATLNNQAHQGVSDGSVGPRSVVVWTHRNGGGGLQFYTGTARDPESGAIPTIASGLDVSAILEVQLRFFEPAAAEAMRLHRSLDIDDEAMSLQITQLPSDPDERLR